jgi:hypothetical protein
MAQMKRCLLLVSLCLITSCAHHVTLTSLGCHSPEGQWRDGPSLDREAQVFTRRIWTSPGQNDIFIREILEREGLECSELKGFEFELTTDSADAFLSLIPFVKRQTLKTWLVL